MNYRLLLEVGLNVTLVLAIILYLFLAIKWLSYILIPTHYLEGVPLISMQGGWFGQLLEWIYLADPTPLIQQGYDKVISIFQGRGDWLTPREIPQNLEHSHILVTVSSHRPAICHSYGALDISSHNAYGVDFICPQCKADNFRFPLQRILPVRIYGSFICLRQILSQCIYQVGGARLDCIARAAICAGNIDERSSFNNLALPWQ